MRVQWLNCMYGFQDSSVCDYAEVSRYKAWRSAHRRLIELVAQGRPKILLPPEMLGDKFDYLGFSCKVRPFGSAPVSLPGGLRPPVDVIAALGPGYEEVLT